MDKEEAQNKENDFGRVIDVLHGKNKLSSLRTYQGDMAQIIKDKNESVVSIAIKEKEQQEQQEEQKKEPNYAVLQQDDHVNSEPKNKSINVNIFLVAVFLIVGGVAVFMLVSKILLNKDTSKQIVKNPEIIAGRNIKIVIDSNKFFDTVRSINYQNGINILDIEDLSGKKINSSKVFFDSISIAPTSIISRTLKDQYVFGAFKKDQKNHLFLILNVSDFGLAFSGMLEWENTLYDDLYFISESNNLNKEDREKLTWVDEIVKNKDIRVLMDSDSNNILAYSFLDKNNIVITQDMNVVVDILSAYTNRNFTR